MISFNQAVKYHLSATKYIQLLSPLLDLALRVWVAKVFFQSGLTKIQSWDSTLMLFAYEYNVPLLSPVAAAYIGTVAELVLPVLLVIGLLNAPTALGLFVFNIVAAISYPDISAAGIKEHMMWGVMLAVTFIHGPGKISLDYWLGQKFNRDALA